MAPVNRTSCRDTAGTWEFRSNYGLRAGLLTCQPLPSRCCSAFWSFRVATLSPVTLREIDEHDTGFPVTHGLVQRRNLKTTDSLRWDGLHKGVTSTTVDFEIPTGSKPTRLSIAQTFPTQARSLNLRASRRDIPYSCSCAYCRSALAGGQASGMAGAASRRPPRGLSTAARGQRCTTSASGCARGLPPAAARPGEARSMGCRPSPGVGERVVGNGIKLCRWLTGSCCLGERLTERQPQQRGADQSGIADGSPAVMQRLSLNGAA